MKQHKTINKTLNPICKNTQKLTNTKKQNLNKHKGKQQNKQCEDN